MKTKKTLGRVSANLINKLYIVNKTIFSIEDAAKILNSSHLAAAKFLSKMTSRNLLMRLKSGKYIIVPQEISGDYIGNWYVAAKEISNSKQYFISHYSALDIHNMTTQPLTKVYVSSPKRQISPRKFKERFKFIYVQPGKIWGIEEKWATNTEKVRVSDIERTIIDCLWQPQYAGGITEIAKGIWIVKEKIDYSKLLEYLLKFRKYVVTKRLGYILETLKIGGSILFKLKDSINDRYDKLDPNLTAEETFKNNWNLIANVDPEEIKNVVRT